MRSTEISCVTVTVTGIVAVCVSVMMVLYGGSRSCQLNFFHGIPTVPDYFTIVLGQLDNLIVRSIVQLNGGFSEQFIHIPNGRTIAFNGQMILVNQANDMSHIGGLYASGERSQVCFYRLTLRLNYAILIEDG